jgi:hypothetical protein
MGPCVRRDDTLCASALTGLLPDSIFKQPSAFSRRDAPELCKKFYPRKTEGAGKAGCPLHPQPRAQSVESTRVRHHRFTGTPGLPCAMVLTVSFALSPVTGLCCHRRLADTSANLTPASGRQDHTTSPSASVPFVSDTATSTASRPASVTIAIRPSEGWDGYGCKSDLGQARTGIFLRKGLDTPSPNSPSGKSGAWAGLESVARACSHPTLWCLLDSTLFTAAASRQIWIPTPTRPTFQQHQERSSSTKPWRA